MLMHGRKGFWGLVWRFSWSSFLLTLPLLLTAQAQLSLDSQARILGGFYVDNKDLAAATIVNSNEWQRAARTASFAASWNSEIVAGKANLLSPSRRGEVTNFFEGIWRTLSHRPKRIIYLFGGPDALYPTQIFPEAEKILMVALQEPRGMINPQNLSLGALAQEMSALDQTFRDVLRDSYFITANLESQLARFGVGPLLAVGLVASGAQLQSMEQVSVNGRGELVSDGSGRIPGLRIRYVNVLGRPAELVYLKQNLYDSALAATPELGLFVQREGFDTAYYKAASYVSHNGQLNVGNSLILNNVRLIVQNDDGLPLRAFRATAQQWKVRLYGYYTPPNSRVFQGRPHDPDMLAAFDSLLCGHSTNADRRLWNQIWGSTCVGRPLVEFRSLSWEGTMPFDYGYAARLGPGILSGAERAKFSNLLIAEKQER